MPAGGGSRIRRRNTALFRVRKEKKYKRTGKLFTYLSAGARAKRTHPRTYNKAARNSMCNTIKAKISKIPTIKNNYKNSGMFVPLCDMPNHAICYVLLP